MENNLKDSDGSVAMIQKRGGRPKSEAWILYNFSPVVGNRGAICGKCKSVQRNTCTSRLRAHYTRCSIGEKASQSRPRPQPLKTHPKLALKVEMETDEEESFLWMNQDDFEDESETFAHENEKEVENENALDKDIQRHRESISTKRKASSPTIDGHLSQFLISSNLTFDIIDSLHFRKFVKAVQQQSEYQLPASGALLKSRVMSAVAGLSLEK